MIPEAAVLDRGLIVSVQAPPGRPCAILKSLPPWLRPRYNGAAGVRFESPEHIGAVCRRCPEALIIGL